MTDFSLFSVSQSDMGNFWVTVLKENCSPSTSSPFPFLGRMLMWWRVSLAAEVSIPYSQTVEQWDRWPTGAERPYRPVLPTYLWEPQEKGINYIVWVIILGPFCYSSLACTWTDTQTGLGKKLISWIQLLLFVSLVRHTGWQILILLCLLDNFLKNQFSYILQKKIVIPSCVCVSW